MADPDVWTIADVCEAFARAAPDGDAVVQGARRVSRADFDRRASGVAAALLAAGLGHQDRVVLYLYNSPEYLEAFVASTKASLVPVNTNYRYGDDELVHLWSDADAAAVVFHGAFVETIARVRSRVTTVRVWLWVDDHSGPCPDWAEPYETAAAQTPLPAPWPRSGEDLVFIYTGGTTGLPKGVMWDQLSIVSSVVQPGGAPPADLQSYVEAQLRRESRDVVLPAPPLMHGMGVMGAIRGLLTGGTVVLLPSRRFDAEELWNAVQAEHVRTVTVVGDAFALPMLEALHTEPGRWELGSVRLVLSAGAMFSEGTKRGILAHLPSAKIVDQLGSSENSGGAMSVSRADQVEGTAAFKPLPGVRVLDEDGRDIRPGTGQVGTIAIPGGAIGYHKDPLKTAATFPLIDGVRHTVAGDHATIDADGTIRFLGRGSVCVNTGGEKVFPEEVEEALKAHPAIRDAVVVGVPDARFGEAVAAVIEVIDERIADAEVIAHVKARLAHYKAPRHLVRVQSIGRGPNGKVDFQATRAIAVTAITCQATA